MVIAIIALILVVLVTISLIAGIRQDVPPSTSINSHETGTVQSPSFTFTGAFHV